MPTEVKLPKLGLTMDEGTIISWEFTEGASVANGDVLFLVETDKVETEVESQTDGILHKILVPAGVTVAVGSLVAIIRAHDEVLEDFELPASDAVAVTPSVSEVSPAISDTIEPRSTASPQVGRASPAAKRRAKELGVNLSDLVGSGPGGRIVEADVEAAATGTPGQTQLTTVRRMSAKRMTESFTTVPHFYLTMEILAEQLVARRRRAKESSPVDISYNDLIVSEVAKAIEAHPVVNSSWSDGELKRSERINVALAMATPEGLHVPVIHDANQLTLEEVATRREELEAAAKETMLRPSDVAGASFTVTNLGAWGVDFFAPIINPPQAAILSVGAIKNRPVLSGDRFMVAPTVYLTLAADHRVLDGVDAASFMSTVRGRLEGDPEAL